MQNTITHIEIPAPDLAKAIHFMPPYSIGKLKSLQKTAMPISELVTPIPVVGSTPP